MAETAIGINNGSRTRREIFPIDSTVIDIPLALDGSVLNISPESLKRGDAEALELVADLRKRGVDARMCRSFMPGLFDDLRGQQGFLPDLTTVARYLIQRYGEKDLSQSPNFLTYWAGEVHILRTLVWDSSEGQPVRNQVTGIAEFYLSAHSR